MISVWCGNVFAQLSGSDSNEISCLTNKNIQSFWNLTEKQKQLYAEIIKWNNVDWYEYKNKNIRRLEISSWEVYALSGDMNTQLWFYYNQSGYLSGSGKAENFYEYLRNLWYWYNYNNLISLFSQNKTYTIEKECEFFGWKKECIYNVYDNKKLQERNDMLKKISQLWINRINWINLNKHELKNVYTLIDKYDGFCQNWLFPLYSYKFMENIHDIESTFSSIAKAKWKDIEWWKFLAIGNFASIYLWEKNYKDGKLVFFGEWQDGLEIVITYITKKWDDLIIKNKQTGILVSKGMIMNKKYIINFFSWKTKNQKLDNAIKEFLKDLKIEKN